VFLVARSQPDWREIVRYLHEVDGTDWYEEGHAEEPGTSDAEYLAEFGGRLCYRSWKPGLNKNVTKVRTDHDAYLRNILAQRHGSVLEHVSYSFVFHNVSRVFTHELVRHRAGVAISQESMRYVRLTDIPFWVPDWAGDDLELLQQAENLLSRVEWFQNWMADRLDGPGTRFAAKKAMTSFMRRFAPDGVATSVLWTANVRTLRHVIEARTAEGAEEEIRLVFGKVAEIMRAEAPALFGDFKDCNGSWVPEWSKV
jgi:thymidylate synthase (FAD)